MDYKIKDINLAAWGHKEIAIAESEMPLSPPMRAVVVRRPSGRRVTKLKLANENGYEGLGGRSMATW